MMYLPVLVTDTNIWIDLENGGVLADVFQLPYQLIIPDLALTELGRPTWATLEGLGLRTHALAAEQVADLSWLRQRVPGLSIIDLAAFLLARSLGAILVTGDRRLYELASANDVTVHGILWLVDGMVHFEALLPTQAAAALRRMLDAGARLPADECTRRLSLWRDAPGG